MFLYLILTVIFITIDQITKYLTVQNLALFETKEIIPNFLSFTYIQNEGAAWSLLEGKMWFFYIITLIVIVFLLYYLYTEGRKNKILGIILSVILAGTIGNFIDRVLFQYVVDMIKLEFINFPIFNVADILLTIGVATLLFYTVYEDKNSNPSKGDMR